MPYGVLPTRSAGSAPRGTALASAKRPRLVLERRGRGHGRDHLVQEVAERRRPQRGEHVPAVAHAVARRRTARGRTSRPGRRAAPAATGPSASGAPVSGAPALDREADVVAGILAAVRGGRVRGVVGRRPLRARRRARRCSGARRAGRPGWRRRGRPLARRAGRAPVMRSKPPVAARLGAERDPQAHARPSTASSKSTSQRMPASTGSPSGSVPSCGVRPTARPAVIGEPVTCRVPVPTVQHHGPGVRQRLERGGRLL